MTQTETFQPVERFLGPQSNRRKKNEKPIFRTVSQHSTFFLLFCRAVRQKFPCVCVCMYELVRISYVVYSVHTTHRPLQQRNVQK